MLRTVVRLADDLGLDPGPEQQQLFERVLTHVHTFLEGKSS